MEARAWSNVKKELCAKECWQPLESGKGKEMDPFLEPSEGNTEPANTLILAQ